MIFLIENANADVVGPAKRIAHSNNLNQITVTIQATAFGGGNITFQAARSESGPWVPITDTGGTLITFSDNGTGLIEGPLEGMYIRATLAGSTNPIGVNVGAI